MSASHSVDVIPVEHHPCPGADNLSLVKYGGFQVVVRAEDWVGRDRGAYVPPDSLVDTKRPEFSFLASKAYSDGYARIRAVKLRGQLSYGLLVPAPEASVVGDDVTHYLGVLHYQPEEEELTIRGPKGPPEGAALPPPTRYPTSKYDLENARKPKFASMLPPDGHGEVIVTEKIHGENARYLWDGEKLHVGSRNNWWKEGHWWVPKNIENVTYLARVLKGYTLYGEMYGAVGGFRYNTGGVRKFILFDIADPCGNWLPWDVVQRLAEDDRVYVPTVPVLYRGPMDMEKVLALAEGPSTLDCSHVREGVVVATPETNRVKLKVHGGGFLAATKKKVDTAGAAG